MRRLSLVLAFLALSLALARTEARADAPASPSWAAAASKSGWDAIAPDLPAPRARAEVAAISEASDRVFLDRAWGLVLARDPESAYAYGLSSIYGIPEDALTDLSDTHAAGTRQLYLALASEVGRRLAERPSGAADELALLAFSRWLGDKAREIELSLDKYLVSPYVNSADQLALDYFTEYRTVRDAAEARRYIACLALLPEKMRGLAAALDLRGKAGIVLPRGIYEYALQGLRGIAEAAPRESPFYTAFAEKLAKASVPDQATRSALLAEAAAAVETSALPAWRALAAALERQRAKVPAEGGAWRLPGGAEYYAACLTRHTGTEADAARLHELGERELARIDGEIRSRFSALGYPSGASLAELYRRLGAAGGYLSGAELLRRIESTIAGMDARLYEIVATRPGIGVEAVFGEMGGYYQLPSIDGARPGRYFVAAGDRRYLYDIATTVYHETLPGHHLQIARSLEADLPGFLRSADFNGFIEGWALYAERLAYEMGAYAGDPAGDLGRLRMEALRAARLVADTGVNALGWTFGEAYAFLERSTGLGAGMLQAEVTRYCIDPGQATSYYAGYAEILSLRDKCEAALGARFDRRQFHEALLSGGTLPFDALERRIEAYIASRARE